jgi:hypothetical protein
MAESHASGKERGIMLKRKSEMRECLSRLAGSDFQLPQAGMRESIAGVEAQRGAIGVARSIGLTGGAQCLAEHNPRMRHGRRNGNSGLCHANGRIGLTAGKRDQAHARKRFSVAGIVSENLLITLCYLMQTRGEPRRLTCARIQLL